MASLNPLTRELVFKLVFYGPGLGGKTTTLQFIHATTKPEHRGKMVSLATPTDRTLYFDFLPLRVPRVRGMSVRLQLFTVPGQVYYGATRKLVLSGADGVVFVADSQAGRMDANQESLEDLNANLAEHSKSLAQLPHTFHWNKRDLSDLVPLDELGRRFNVHDAPTLGTCATRGDGVFEGLERITRLVLRHYESELPKGEQPILGLGVGGAEVSIAEAIRGLAEAPLVTKITPFHGMAAVRPEEAKPSAESEARISSAAVTMPPSNPNPAMVAVAAPAAPIATVSLPVAPAPKGPSSSATNTLSPASRAAAAAVMAASAGVQNDPELNFAPASLAAPLPPPPAAPSVPQAAPAPAALPVANGEAPAVSVPPDLAVPTIAPPPGTSHFSLAELWPEGEREAVRQTETLIGARDAHGAVLACDTLLTRVLASAGSLTGTADAPRDPGLVSLLLGLDGKRYLVFRASVRAARQREEVSIREALDCFTFVLEARVARDALSR